MDIEIHKSVDSGCFESDGLRTLQIDVVPFAWVIGVATVNPSRAVALTRHERRCVDALNRDSLVDRISGVLSGTQTAIAAAERRVRDRQNRFERVVFDGVYAHWLTLSNQSST